MTRNATKLLVRAERMSGPLRDRGFIDGYPTYSKASFSFIRHRKSDGLYESIVVEFQGKKLDAVFASVGVSVTKAVMYKVLGDVKLLDEIAEDQQRGWTIITNETKGIEWESAVVRIGPDRAAEWADLRSQVILQSTLESRAAVERYLRIIGSDSSIEDLRRVLLENCNSQLIEDAKQMQVGGVPGTEEAHELACLVVLAYSADVENGRSFIGINPWNNMTLMERIKILADRLIDRQSSITTPKAT